MVDTSLITFKAISNFTNELGETFGGKQKSLKLYCRLINKTTIVNEKPIQKHICAFTDFCKTNRNAILEKNIEKLETTTISYSERVYINIEQILKIADKETKEVIWSHLLTLSAIVDPLSKAKEILKKQNEKSDVNNEQDFLSNIIDKVEQNVDPSSTNPMEAVSSILNSGIFSELLGSLNNGVENGNLDMNKLMGSVQNMVSKMSENVDDEKSKDTINQMGEMMNSINLEKDEPQNSNVQPPDLTQMLGPMMNMLGNLQNPSGNIDDSNTQQTTPDLTQMLGPMMSMLGNLQNPSGNIPSTNSIENDID
jgi:hypothetical protein